MLSRQLYFGLATLVLGACAEPVTAPSAPPVELPDFVVTRQSTPFNPTIGVDTTFLEQWEGFYGAYGCPNDMGGIEWRAVSLWADGQPVGTRGDRPNARSLWVSSSQPSDTWVTEHAPLVAFRPHRNTRESINMEAYILDGWCVSSRKFGGIQWWWYDNGVRKVVTQHFVDPTGDFYYDMGVSLSWQAVDYPVAYHQMLANGGVQPSNSLNEIASGDTVVFSEGDYAANGVEIYNGPSRAWSVANTAIAQVLTPAGHLVASSFGVNWSRQSTEIVARLAGTTSVTVGSSTYTLPVIPKVTVSGATRLEQDEGAVFTASAIGCNTTCQYNWYVDDGDDSYYQGTGSSITIYGEPSWFSFVEVRAVASTNGMIGEGSRHVQNSASSCGTQVDC